MYQKIKRKIYLLLDHREGGTWLDKAINTFIISLIILNTFAVIVETVQPLYRPNKKLFDDFEFFSVVVFSIEYVLRVWTATCMAQYKGSFRGRLKYVFSTGALIDLAAILPFYLPMLTTIDLRMLRSLRLLRFFRFFKIGRYINASKVVTKVLREKKEELVISFIITVFLIIVASSLMFYTEHDAQPGKFSSIPETMWWSVATLTTVGYGDLYPVTALGKTLAACISILGIGLFALPAGILASGFSDEFKKVKAKKKCPRCGEEVET